ncbi:sensor histidine kinase [Methylophaga sp. OBS4]|uniref:sensor histidine kinase n=1 Tax=Methylophaga sp. OBS4 TaxID=2991935 RepID=UPI002258DEE6|nr:ATP-binding protein [Methylophaga sp. OBS4]MCX4187376.1 ATP-binding protein [Methylophaga sp. OBS4]
MNLKLSARPDAINHSANARIALRQAEQYWQPASQPRQPEPLSKPSSPTDKAERLANRHSRLLAVLPAGVVVLDGEGFVQEVNAAAIALLGEPLAGERWIDIIERAFRPQPGDGHDVSLKDGRLVHISTSPLDSEPGQIVLLHDVTETRSLQNKVSHLQRLSTMGEVAARLAHQIRTPLASALLYLAPLLREDSEPSVKQRFAQRLRDRLIHMEQLVKDLLAFSRGDMAASTSPVAINSLLREIEQQFMSQPHADNYHLQIHNAVNDGHVYGSQTALASAINNLLNNARQACGEQGNITIFAEYVEDEEQRTWIEISVEDDGMGISPADRDKIMAPFYTTRSSGTGLGLAVVQSIAKAHKGYMWLDSDEGEGSTFSLRLPVYQAQSPFHRTTVSR